MPQGNRSKHSTYVYICIYTPSIKHGIIENSFSQLKHIMMRSTAIKSCDGTEQMVFAKIQEFRGRFHKKRKKQQEFLISE